MNRLRSFASLFLATGLLLTGQGLHLTLLPLRAESVGFTEAALGLTASAYYMGFVTGCFFIPQLIARVGHIRMFSALVATYASALLAIDLTNHTALWIVLRFLLGAMMCGAYTVIESWITDQTPSDARGKVLAVYTFLVLAAITLGQFLINIAPVETSRPFIIAGILVGLAIVPISLTKSLAPAPVSSTKLSFSLLYKRSHTAFAASLASGIVMGSFWSLGALYALRATGDYSFAPLFISAVIAGGALAQYPVGYLSDRYDRRFVLAGLCAATAVFAAFINLSDTRYWLMGIGFLFGASSNAIYAVALAKAADNSEPSEFVTIASSVLLQQNLGAVVAPLLIGQFMEILGDRALFLSIAGCAGLATVYIAFQPKGKTAVSVDDQAPFVAAGYETAPASFDNDPRNEEEIEGDLEPSPELPSYAEFEGESDVEEELREA